MFHSIDILHTSLNPTTDRIVVELDGVVIQYQNFGTPPNSESQFTSGTSNFFFEILSIPNTPPAQTYSDIQFLASLPNSIAPRFLTSFPNLTVVGDCYTVSLTQTNVNFPNLNIVFRLWSYNNYTVSTPTALWDFATDGLVCHFTQVKGGFTNGQNSITGGACCVAKGSLVATVDGYRPIEQLRVGQQLIDVDGKSVELLQLVKFNHPVTKSICIPPGSLDVNSPDQVLHICSGHPILLNGVEVDPESLIGSRGISYQNQPIFVYTLLTEHRSFVDIQNCQVCTWSHDAWLNFAENGSKRVGSWEFSG